MAAKSLTVFINADLSTISLSDTCPPVHFETKEMVPCGDHIYIYCIFLVARFKNKLLSYFEGITYALAVCSINTYFLVAEVGSRDVLSPPVMLCWDTRYGTLS